MTFFLYFSLYQTLAAARMLTPSGPGGQTHWGDSASNSPSPATHSADAQLKVLIELPQSLIADWYSSMHIAVLPTSFWTYIACWTYLSIPFRYWAYSHLCFLLSQQELAAIFKKIGDKQTCTIGLYELYRITQLYPKVKTTVVYIGMLDVL